MATARLVRDLVTPASFGALHQAKSVDERFVTVQFIDAHVSRDGAEVVAAHIHYRPVVLFTGLKNRAVDIQRGCSAGLWIAQLA